MKIGKTINELAAYLTDVQENARDFIVPTAKLSMRMCATEADKPSEPRLTFENDFMHDYKLNNWSHRQLATYAEIPQSYYDRIQREKPELFTKMVNHGLNMQDAAALGRTETRMIRTYRGQVRAMVSRSHHH